ncbi:MAG: GNAT family N-acetyltransferase [Prevotellaceae bacterium]|jgi:hypothetical protein|nr:GNAT family N-acetyltransferase [Prevotellaceae bacterium]
MPLKLTTYSQSRDIPDLPGTCTFHSTELFRIYEATSGYTPLLVVASDDGKPLGKLLAVVQRNRSLCPPLFIKRCEIFGTGEYADDVADKEVIFGEMLHQLTDRVLREAFVIEFRNLSNALFGYKAFRRNHYFAVNWLRVYNSLHNLNRVEERFSPSRIRQIKKGLKNGAEVRAARSPEEVRNFAHILFKIYSSKIRRYFPNKEFFSHLTEQMMGSGQAGIFVVIYKEKIIGGSACLYSDDTAYLWFSGGMRKTYLLQYPGVLAVWGALRDARERGFRHLEFMDVGLPFRRHGYRDFVLRFGGKQVGTRRWFRFRWIWLNRLMNLLYK